MGDLPRFILLPLCFALLLTGCFKTQTKTPLMKQAENLEDVSTVQLRSKAYDFVQQFALITEDAADQILNGSTDPEIRLNALRWKMNMVPTAHAAAFNNDPLIALIDIGALCYQQEAFFKSGFGKDLFGEWQPVAVTAVERISRDFWKLADSINVTGDSSRARADIAEWAEANPFDDTYFLRPSIQPLLMTLTGVQGKGIGAALGGVTDQVADLTDRLTIYGESIPKQARWQAELLVREIVEEIELDEIAATTDRLIDSVERVTTTVEATPDLISGERRATTDALEEIVLLIIAAADRQRIDSIEMLRGERMAVLEALRVEREAVIAAVSAERGETMTDVDGLLARSVDLSFDRAEELIDGLFWRALVLLALGAVVLAVIGLVVARNIRVGTLSR